MSTYKVGDKVELHLTGTVIGVNDRGDMEIETETDTWIVEMADSEWTVVGHADETL